jgi:uncharacterized protein (TIGR03790 family)
MKTFCIRARLFFLLASLGAAWPCEAGGPQRRTPDEVLVVINKNSPISKAVGQDYSAKRGVKNIVTVGCQDSAVDSAGETIALGKYRKLIEGPIRRFLETHPKVQFIVLTKGIPIRIAGAPMGSCDMNNPEVKKGIYRPSLDSYLAALDYTDVANALQIQIAGSGAVGIAYSNRYWNATEPFSHEKFGGYLVTRLDGYTEADAKALVTRSLEAEKGMARFLAEGKVLLDTQPIFGDGDKATAPLPILGTNIPAESPYSDFNADMRRAGDVLASRGFPVELDLTTNFIGGRSNLLGYFSWGSNDERSWMSNDFYSPEKYLSLFFAPGSVSDTAVSTSGRTFLPTHGGQSLLTDLIAHGLTGGKGYVDEPLLQAIASPTIVFDRYTSGYTLAESFYAHRGL